MSAPQLPAPVDLERAFRDVKAAKEQLPSSGYDAAHRAADQLLALLDRLTVPLEPWKVISRDQHSPTLARLWAGRIRKPIVREWWIEGDRVCSTNTLGQKLLEWALWEVVRVDVLHVPDPATEVVVPLELVDRLISSSGRTGIRELAALAAAAEKGADQ